MADKPKPPKASPLKTTYLILYNFASAVAWSVVLGRTILLLYLHGPASVYAHTGEWTKWTQTMAVMEVLHSLLGTNHPPAMPSRSSPRLSKRTMNDRLTSTGIVRAPLATTGLQVSSRLLLVWPIVNTWPFLALSPLYSSMLVAWSVTEVIRYSYFALSLAGALPDLLTWVRYSTFYLLYPMGITSECMLIYAATGPAAQRGSIEPLVLYAILAIYVPGKFCPEEWDFMCGRRLRLMVLGSYVLFTHMMKQRGKVMRSLKAKDGKTQ
jgi:very-long-chain (3R)-3-hydroxyacyl-CoA dehydratase